MAVVLGACTLGSPAEPSGSTIPIISPSAYATLLITSNYVDNLAKALGTVRGAETTMFQADPYSSEGAAAVRSLRTAWQAVAMKLYDLRELEKLGDAYRGPLKRLPQAEVLVGRAVHLWLQALDRIDSIVAQNQPMASAKAAIDPAVQAEDAASTAVVGAHDEIAFLICAGAGDSGCRSPSP